MSNVWFQKISIPPLPPPPRKIIGNSEGEWGGHQRPLGLENPGGWGVQIKESSVGGVWIFSGTIQLGIVDKGN